MDIYLYLNTYYNTTINMNILLLNNPRKFEEFLYKKIDLNLYEHKFLNIYLKAVKRGGREISNNSLINYTEDGWILILLGELLMVYGRNWSLNQINEITRNFDLNKFESLTINGNTQLINELLIAYNIENYSTEKDRILYKTRTVKKYNYENFKIELGCITDLNELASMMQQYFHEEYKGQNDKSINQMQNKILQRIDTKSIYVLKNLNDNILSFCTLINPDIGILFTKNEHRRKGYGKYLLSYCSNILIEKNGEVYLTTDSVAFASNKVCKEVGFTPYFDQSLIKINSN